MSYILNYSRKKPGKVYMFLPQKFKGHSPRNKCDVEADAANITKCFRKLGFWVRDPLRNLNMKQIKSHLTKAYHSRDLSNYESIFIFFVTHSPEDGQLLCKDGIFSVEEIMKIFIDGVKHPNLRKIIVFQTFQATTTECTEVSQATEKDATPFVLPPPGANFFIIKSSFELASPYESGSFFIKIFCLFMAKELETSLFDVTTEVLSVLKATRNVFPEDRRNNKLPEVASTLLKPFLLNGKTPFNLPCYERKESMGKLVVFNYNYNSDKSVNATIKPREGTQFDVARIKISFESVGFKVEINNDLRADDVRKTLENGSQCREPSCKSKQCGLRHKGDSPADYSKDTCAAIAVMSHGCENNFETIDEIFYVTNALSKLIMTEKPNEERKDLSGKPKILFQQVCQEKNDKQYIQPLQFDDTLIFNSCFPGCKSNRSPTEGSWFIQELCKTIDRLPHNKSVSMTDLLQDVQRKFVEKHGSEQMPVIYSTLTKNLIFNKAPSKYLAKL